MGISVVIITKNEAVNIVDCITSARMISDDIIVVDSGSSDDTVLLAAGAGVRVESITWKGYGHARNTGAMFAANDWILSLDADERITRALASAIGRLGLEDEDVVYGFHRENYFGNVRVRHGELAHDRVFRIYNRLRSRWNLVPVHEKLVGTRLKRVALDKPVVHFGIRNGMHYRKKKMGYASLCALKYFQERKRFITALRYLSPFFNFIKSYIFQLGFLDKRIGFTVARINAQYTSKEYRKLIELKGKELQQPGEFTFIRRSVRRIISLLS